MNLQKLFYLLLCLAILLSCDEEDIALSTTPELELVAVAPTLVQEFKDSVVITLKYKDGDGDLGGVHPDSNNLFVEDSRIDVTYKYRIQELVPNGAEVPIQGNLNVVINSLFRVDDAEPSEQVVFSIYALDKAGNRSNTVVTDAITVEE